MKFGKINHFSTRMFLIILGAILPFLILLIYNAEVEREAVITGAVNITLRLAQTVVSDHPTMILEPDWFNKTYASMAQDYPGVDLLVFDSKGAVLTYLPNNNQESSVAKALLEQANGKSNVAESGGAEGTQHIFGIMPISNSPGGQPLYVAVGIPLVDFELAGNQIFYRDLIFCGLALILSLLSYRLISSWLVIRVLQPVLQTARRFRDGDLSARVHASPDETDIGRLAQAFDEMADTNEQRSKDLELSSEKYRELFMKSPIGLYRSAPDGIILDANKTLMTMLGFDSEVKNVPFTIGQFIVDPKMKETWNQVKDSQKRLVDYELCLSKEIGEIIYVLDNARAITSPDGNTLFYEGSLQDITSRKRAEEKLSYANQKLHMVLDSMTDAYVAWDKDWKFLEINAVAKQGLYDGRPVEDLLGKVLWEEYPQSVEPEFYQKCISASHEDHPVLFEVKSTKTGEWWEIHAYPSPERFEIYIRDITERKLNEAIMQELAFHDPLTGLLNRKAFDMEMQRFKAHVARSGQKMAIFYMDIDHFKNINDQYAHTMGDIVLKDVAARILGLIRKEDIFSRIGGDEFILSVEITEVDEARLIAERILNSFEDPVKLNGETIQISLSIGIGIYPDDTNDPEEVIQLADHAMYQNKRNKKWRLSQDLPVPSKD